MEDNENRRRKSLDLQLFVKKIGRKAHAGHDPNDRQYDRDIARKLRQIPPQELDALLRGEDD